MPSEPLIRRLGVLRAEPLTANMRRLVLGGEELRGFEVPPGSWGPYVKLLIPRPDGAPAVRTYSVRDHDPVRHEITIDVVLHAPRGIASHWAETVRPGDAVGLRGPGAVPVAADPDWVVLAGDHSALPAIAYTLERLPAATRGLALIALDDAADRQPLETPDGVEIRWLERVEDLAATVRAAPWPRGDVVLWAGAEAAPARKLRAFARVEKAFDQDRRPILNYWKRGTAEGDFSYAE